MAARQTVVRMAGPGAQSPRITSVTIPRCIIFDLSEVLIAGLVGIERELSWRLSLPEDEILPCFGVSLFRELLVGNVSEDAYLRQVVAGGGWSIDIATLKALIRDNFHNEVEGTLDILKDLASRHDLALLSDNAREWVSYIRSIHPFLEVFRWTFFSYDLRGLKCDARTFRDALDVMALAPHDCLFVDDNPKNVSVAESVGIPSIRFVDTGQLATELCRRGV